MADITAFLQNGQIPEGSALTSMTNETHLPDWYRNYAQQIIANQNAVAATPYQTYQGPRVAGFNPTQQQGFEQTLSAAGAYQPGLAAGTDTTNAAAGQPGALATAAPWLQRAGQSTVSGIGQYMSPYTDAVVNRIGEIGQRNLSEHLMPAITSKFISAGQLGVGGRNGNIAPSGMLTDTARAVRDTNADILGQQTQALQQGYTQATNLAAGDLARYGQIGQITGNLASQQQTDALRAGAQQADMAGLAQKYGLTGADAVGAIGKQQQGQTQQNYDVAYQDFLRQQGFPQEQIDHMLASLKGVQGAVPTATTQQGIQPTGASAQYAPSTASTIAGVGLTLADLAKKFGIL